MRSSLKFTLNRSYAILGTGALGGYYGACLQRAELDVHFLLHSDREHVSKHGLVIESPEDNFSLPQVRAYDDVSQMPRCDVVAVTKTTQNHLLSTTVATCDDRRATITSHHVRLIPVQFLSVSYLLRA